MITNSLHYYKTSISLQSFYFDIFLEMVLNSFVVKNFQFYTPCKVAFKV